jgi:hypothetical protein
VSGVFDQGKVVAVREGAEPLHVDHLAVEVNRNHGLGARRDGGFDSVRVEQAGGGVDVGEDRGGTGVQHGVRGSDERHRGRDDFVSGADAEGEQSQVQPVGAARDAHGVGHAKVRSEEVFELGHARAGRQEQRGQRRPKRRDLFVTQIVAKELDLARGKGHGEGRHSTERGDSHVMAIWRASTCPGLPGSIIAGRGGAIDPTG